MITETTENNLHPRTDCWICLCESSLEEHHIVPRAYGGSNGPLCTLCSVCHSAVHKLSYEYDKVLAIEYGQWDTSMADKGWYLASIIKRAKVITSDQQRNIKAGVTLDPQTHKMLQILTKTIGSTQEKTILYAIKELYTKMIGDAPI